MLKKLRRKFIALNMAIAALVLAVAFGAIVYITYQQSVNAVYTGLDEALEMANKHFASENVEIGEANANADANAGTGAATNESAAEGESASAGEITAASASVDASTDTNAGASDGTASESSVATASDSASVSSPASTPGPTSDTTDAAANADTSEPSTSTSTSTAKPAPPQIGGKHGDGRQVLPAAICVVNRNSDAHSLITLGTASVSEDLLEQAVAEAQSAEADHGKLSSLGLFFAKRPLRSGEIIAFADTNTATSWQRLAATFAGAGVAILAALFVINMFFSRWALRPVERAWLQQQQFVADASHELKTPLTVILANTAILRGKPQATIASQSQWIESTQTEATRMQELVGDMLDLARPEGSANATAAHTRVDFSDLIEGTVLQFESVAFERAVSLENQLEPGLCVLGDEKRLQRLASTLVDNACKYTDRGGLVRVTLSAQAREVRFDVHNSGTPIAPEDLPHVFDRFYRADKARAATDDGSRSYGLGLAIAREVAREHGGTIAVKSTPEHGTTFSVALPQAI